MKIKIKKKIKILAISFILFFVFFWILAPDSSIMLPTENIYKLIIPKYPNAKNIKKNLGCDFEFEIEKDELGAVKKYYENSFVINILFNYQPGRSYFHGRETSNGDYYYQNFSNYYYQRLNLTHRGLKIYGANYSDGTTKVKIKCKNWSYF